VKKFPTVAASSSNGVGIELVEFEGVDRILNRDAVGYYYTIQRSPEEPKSRVAVLFSGTVLYVNTDAFDLPLVENKEMRFSIFAEAAIGDYLDDRGLPESTAGSASATKIECFSDHFKQWADRRPASDEEIEDYLAAHLLWAWRFDHESWEVSLSDCLRLRRSLKFIGRLIRLGQDVQWNVTERPPHSILVAPVPAFVRKLRDVSRGQRPKRSPEDPQKSTDASGERSAHSLATEYDVALSFAGENRDYVERVAAKLKELGVRVFYDKFEEVELWGKNLADHLGRVYASGSRFVVMFVSKYYAAKAWPTYERQQAQAKAIQQKTEFVLPVRFDDTEIPGLTSSVAYLDARSCTPEDIATRILRKLARGE
jgi:hypothetical protein